MARRRKHRKHHVANPRRHRRSRRASRHFLRNPAPLSMGGVGSALLWGGMGYVASKLAGSFASKYLPASIPAKDLVSAAVSGGVVSYAGGMIAKSGEARAALRVGALIPVVEAAVNMTSLGAMLGTQKVIVIPAPATGGQGMQAALHAALSADLRDGDEYSGY